MVRTQIQLSEAQAQALREAAAREKTSGAEIIRRALDQWLKAGKRIPAKDRRRRATSVIGQFRSGKRDISERHDDYLDAEYRK